MSRHTALLDLPDVIEALGGNVVALDGWDTAQGSYFWQQGSYGDAPTGYMVHHTAGTVAYPTVRNSRGEWSKANAWIGYGDQHRLSVDPSAGPALIVLTASGPARVSSGYGVKSVWQDYVMQDRRAPWKTTLPDDDWAGNRWYFNVETVHPGDRTALGEDAWQHVCVLGEALHRMFGWRERTAAHCSHTSRKIDPRWSTGRPHDGDACIIDIQDELQRRLHGHSHPHI